MARALCAATLDAPLRAGEARISQKETYGAELGVTMPSISRLYVSGPSYKTTGGDRRMPTPPPGLNALNALNGHNLSSKGPRSLKGVGWGVPISGFDSYVKW